MNTDPVTVATDMCDACLDGFLLNYACSFDSAPTMMVGHRRRRTNHRTVSSNQRTRVLLKKQSKHHPNVKRSSAFRLLGDEIMLVETRSLSVIPSGVGRTLDRYRDIGKKPESQRITQSVGPR
jgi:hypothetical protein